MYCIILDYEKEYNECFKLALNSLALLITLLLHTVTHPMNQN